MNDFDQKLHVGQKLSIGNSIETFPIQNTLRFTQNDKKTKNLNIIFFFHETKVRKNYVSHFNYFWLKLLNK